MADKQALLVENPQPGDMVRVEFGAANLRAEVIREFIGYIEVRLFWDDGTDDDPRFEPMHTFYKPEALRPL